MLTALITNTFTKHVNLSLAAVVTLTLPHTLWPIFRDNRFLLNRLFGCAAKIFLGWAKQLGIDIGVFSALHTYLDLEYGKTLPRLDTLLAISSLFNKSVAYFAGERPSLDGFDTMELFAELQQRYTKQVPLISNEVMNES